MTNSVWVICETLGYGDAAQVIKTYGFVDNENDARNCIIELAYEESVYKKNYLVDRVREATYENALEIEISQPGVDLDYVDMIVAVEVKQIDIAALLKSM